MIMGSTDFSCNATLHVEEWEEDSRTKISSLGLQEENMKLLLPCREKYIYLFNLF